MIPPYTVHTQNNYGNVVLQLNLQVNCIYKLHGHVKGWRSNLEKKGKEGQILHLSSLVFHCIAF